MFPYEKLDPSEVNGLGILLGDKKAGPFKLEVEWIKASTHPITVPSIQSSGNAP